MRMPKGVILDLGDTVLSFQSYDHSAGCSRILEYAMGAFTMSSQDAARLSEKIGQELFSLGDKSLIQYKHTDFIKLLCTHLGISLTIDSTEAERLWWQSSMKYIPSPEIFDALSALGDKGIKTGILSNSSFSSEILAEELDRHNLCHQFAFVISSADYGIRKPNSFLFQAAVARMGMSPADIWFIGDSLEYDIAGAMQANLYPVWYNARRENPNTKYPCLEVKGWAEFAQVIRSLDNPDKA